MARRASDAPSGPLTISLPGKCSRSSAMLSQVMLALNLAMPLATVPDWKSGAGSRT